MTNYQVTFGYKAVISIAVKAVDENEAKEKAKVLMRKARERMASGSVTLEDDTYGAKGILNMDETWNQL